MNADTYIDYYQNTEDFGDYYEITLAETIADIIIEVIYPNEQGEDHEYDNN